MTEIEPHGWIVTSTKDDLLEIDYEMSKDGRGFSNTPAVEVRRRPGHSIPDKYKRAFFELDILYSRFIYIAENCVPWLEKV
jgi:hypothetical protein